MIKLNKEHKDEIINSIVSLCSGTMVFKKTHQEIIRIACEMTIKEMELIEQQSANVALKKNCELCEQKDFQIEILEHKLKDTELVVRELFSQSCRTEDGLYDNQCISTYEDAQEFLLRIGLIKEEDCIRL